FEHEFRVIFGVPSRAAIFLVVNGVILYLGERYRPRTSRDADQVANADRELAAVGAPRSAGAHATGQRAVRQREISEAIQADRRVSGGRHGGGGVSVVARGRAPGAGAGADGR